MKSGRVVPNFFVVGAQKAGTTFMCHHLAAHENIRFTKRKETFVFGKKDMRRKDFKNYLKRFFPPHLSKPTATVFAEGSATYLQSRLARRNIPRMLGSDFKVMASLRDPVTKTISWYMHNYARGRFDASHSILDNALLRRSHYASHVARWQKAIGRERFRAVTYDLLKEDPLKFVNTALEYLNLEPFTELSLERVNAGFKIVRRGDFLEPVFTEPDMKQLAVPRFPMRDIAELHALFRDDVERTQDLTGLDLSKWLEEPQFKRAADENKKAAA